MLAKDATTASAVDYGEPASSPLWRPGTDRVRKAGPSAGRVASQTGSSSGRPRPVVRVKYRLVWRGGRFGGFVSASLVL